MSEESRHDGRFWVGFFIGGLLGAITLFFLGTKEGKKTGKLLEKKSEDFIDGLESRLDELEKKGKELAKQGEEIKTQVIDTIEDKKEELTDGATESLDTALANIEAIQERGRKTTAEIRKRLFKNLPKKQSS
ncbi:YtxH domain-containing protein [Patescibacteria group bacterium]|nr:YtxH domain-containing protein [Patescibacteria group bacterium]